MSYHRKQLDVDQDMESLTGVVSGILSAAPSLGLVSLFKAAVSCMDRPVRVYASSSQGPLVFSTYT